MRAFSFCFLFCLCIFVFSFYSILFANVCVVRVSPSSQHVCVSLSFLSRARVRCESVVRRACTCILVFVLLMCVRCLLFVSLCVYLFFYIVLARACVLAVCLCCVNFNFVVFILFFCFILRVCVRCKSVVCV